MCCAHSIARYSVGKLTTPSARCARQRRELQRERARPRERAFAADQQVREVDAAVGGVRPLALRVEDVEVVAADAAQHLRHLRSISSRSRSPIARSPSQQLARRAAARASISRSGPKRASVPSASSASIATHVVHHVAVGDRARAAGIVAGHAAQRRLRRRADVDREPQAVRLQPRVELVEHDAGLDGRPSSPRGRSATMRLRCLLWSMTSAAPTVWPHCELPAPRGSTGTRSSRQIVDRRAHVVVGLRHQHADRLDLVDRRVGRVAAARRRRRTAPRPRRRAAGARRDRRCRGSGGTRSGLRRSGAFKAVAGSARHGERLDQACAA